MDGLDEFSVVVMDDIVSFLKRWLPKLFQLQFPSIQDTNHQ